jgi:hypothetical protein
MFQLASLEAEKQQLVDAKSALERDSSSHAARALELTEKVKKLEASLSLASQPAQPAGAGKPTSYFLSHLWYKRTSDFISHLSYTGVWITTRQLAK